MSSCAEPILVLVFRGVKQSSSSRAAGLAIIIYTATCAVALRLWPCFASENWPTQSLSQIAILRHPSFNASAISLTPRSATANISALALAERLRRISHELHAAGVRLRWIIDYRSRLSQACAAHL